MIATQLQLLADAIKARNTYFDQAFADVFMDSKLGYVYSNPAGKGEREVVFPADHLGDYFYLRMPKAWTFSNAPEYHIADGIIPLGITGTIVLVASMAQADGDKLAANIINTLRGLTCGGGRIVLQGAIGNREEVIYQELEGMEEEEQLEAAANASASGRTLVSVTFTFSNAFPYNSCNLNPCPTC